MLRGACATQVHGCVHLHSIHHLHAWGLHASLPPCPPTPHSLQAKRASELDAAERKALAAQVESLTSELVQCEAEAGALQVAPREGLAFAWEGPPLHTAASDQGIWQLLLPRGLSVAGEGAVCLPGLAGQVPPHHVPLTALVPRRGPRVTCSAPWRPSTRRR